MFIYYCRARRAGSSRAYLTVLPVYVAADWPIWDYALTTDHLPVQLALNYGSLMWRQSERQRQSAVMVAHGRPVQWITVAMWRAEVCGEHRGRVVNSRSHMVNSKFASGFW